MDAANPRPARSAAAQVTIGYDAAKHLRHYLKGSGNELEIDLEGMIGEVPSAATRGT